MTATKDLAIRLDWVNEEMLRGGWLNLPPHFIRSVSKLRSLSGL